jgi:hypothetical protein
MISGARGQKQLRAGISTKKNNASAGCPPIEKADAKDKRDGFRREMRFLE